LFFDLQQKDIVLYTTQGKQYSTEYINAYWRLLQYSL